MAYELRYTVENAQAVTMTAQTEFDGEMATVSFERAVIECLPVQAGGKTFTMTLPVEALADFPEGAGITVTVSPEN